MLWATLGTSSPFVHFSVNLDDRSTPVKTSFKFKEEALTSNTIEFSLMKIKFLLIFSSQYVTRIGAKLSKPRHDTTFPRTEPDQTELDKTSSVYGFLNHYSCQAASCKVSNWPGVYPIKVFWHNFTYSFCKLYLFIAMQQILLML
jgi:hypothetical protein